MPKNKEDTSDPQIEFVKQCHLNHGLPIPSLVACPEVELDNKYVVIDRSILDGQSTSMGNIFKDYKFPV